MTRIATNSICAEDAIYTQHGSPSSPDTLAVCKQKCSDNPDCTYFASWEVDKGCRHYGEKCTPIHGDNGPSLFKLHTPSLESLAGTFSDQARRTNIPNNMGVQLPKPARLGSVEKKELIPIIVLCYNRPAYLRKTLTSLSSKIGNYADTFPVYVSRQGNDAGVGQVLEEFQTFVKGINQYNWQDNGQRKKGFEGANWLSYYKISQHYASALRWIFGTQAMSRVVVLEDDLNVSVDFFEYFKALAPVYDRDPTVFCVSAWNDNGMRSVVDDNKQLLRTDVFPGLGWMMNRRVYTELIEKWPLAFWDDWMREKSQPHGRSCIVPEVNRVYTFGDHGNSVDNGFWKKFLEPIRLNDEFVSFTTADLSGIEQPAYGQKLADEIKSMTPVDMNTARSTGGLVVYHDEKEFMHIANNYGIQHEFKNGDPRSSFGHVNAIRLGGKRVFIVDQSTLTRVQTGVPI